METKIKSYFFKSCLIGGLVLSVFSCKKEKEEPGPGGTTSDTITRFQLALDAPKGKLDAVAFFTDPNGISNQTAVTSVTVDANTIYTGTLTLEDESKTPKATVTKNYTVSYRITGIDATITGGATPTLTTKSTGDGTLNVTLTKADKSKSIAFPITVRQ
ncbi:hypothetical protein [Adhaeribacter aquaticus]|uniref:hypothetical protein n=1 Tax=Adhaeribacter aquaticus TaxID=299567 RepID=UPI0003FD1DFD|nr:hypothetical protein [Adhaeribacter aquaticus]